MNEIKKMRIAIFILIIIIFGQFVFIFGSQGTAKELRNQNYLLRVANNQLETTVRNSQEKLEGIAGEFENYRNEIKQADREFTDGIKSILTTADGIDETIAAIRQIIEAIEKRYMDL